MAVFRVERNTGYTVMSNHHLRNKELSLKAKGLLSQMLSLPEDWDYTLAGLSHINREKIDAIREAVKELEKAGYIVRSRERDEKGRFCNEKSALFIVLPEEDLTKYFMVSLMIQQLYREILAVADENGGKLKNRVMFYCDELGTLPAIESLELIFSASRSRRLSMVPIIQSFGQLEKNYGKEGSEIIVDNCQDTIFGGFAPNSQTAEVLSKALGSRTVMSGSVSRGKNDPSQSLQMMERTLMTPDELKSIPKGSFVVMKTGTHPMRTKLRLFLDWGIRFGEPYTVEEKAHRKVVYADKNTLEENIVRKHMACIMVDEDTGEILESTAGTGTLHTPVAESTENAVRRRTVLKT